MMALPCGHQICLADLKRLNMDMAPVVPVVVRVAPVVVRVLERRRRNRLQRVRVARLQRRRQRMEHDIRIMHINNRGRRCGWCGLQGHTVSKCRKHRFQCGCSDGKSRRHKHILSTKRMCRVCKHRGHRSKGCFKVVKYR